MPGDSLRTTGDYFKTGYRESDSLPGPDPILGWMKHVLDNSRAIGDIAQRHSWPTDLGRVLGVALHIYDAAGSSTEYGMSTRRSASR